MLAVAGYFFLTSLCELQLIYHQFTKVTTADLRSTGARNSAGLLFVLFDFDCKRDESGFIYFTFTFKLILFPRSDADVDFSGTDGHTDRHRTK